MTVVDCCTNVRYSLGKTSMADLVSVKSPLENENILTVFIFTNFKLVQKKLFYNINIIMTLRIAKGNGKAEKGS